MNNHIVQGLPPRVYQKSPINPTWTKATQQWYTPNVEETADDLHARILPPVPSDEDKFVVGMLVWHANKPYQLGKIVTIYTSLLDVEYVGEKVLLPWNQVDVLRIGSYVLGRSFQGLTSGWVTNINTVDETVRIVRRDLTGNIIPDVSRFTLTMSTLVIGSPPWCIPSTSASTSSSPRPWSDATVKLIETSSRAFYPFDRLLSVTNLRFEAPSCIMLEVDAGLSIPVSMRRLWVPYEHVVEAKTRLRLIAYDPLRGPWRVNGATDAFVLSEVLANRLGHEPVRPSEFTLESSQRLATNNHSYSYQPRPESDVHPPPPRRVG